MPSGDVDHIRKRRRRQGGRRHVDTVKRAIRLDTALTELRELRSLSQAEVADGPETSRPNVSRIEKEAHVRLSTLERYVGAIGAKA